MLCFETHYSREMKRQIDCRSTATTQILGWNSGLGYFLSDPFCEKHAEEWVKELLDEGLRFCQNLDLPPEGS